MWALSPISAQEFSPSKPSNVSMTVLEFENSGTCSTPEREGTLSCEGSFAQTPGVSPSLAALPTSGSLTPFQQFQRKDPDLQVKSCIIFCPLHSTFNSIMSLLLDLHLQEILKF